MSERSTFEQTVANARRSGDRRRLASSLGSLGNICAREGAISLAVKYLQESRQVYNSLGDRQGEAQACFNLASVYDRALHDNSHAIRLLREALTLDPDNHYYRGILKDRTGQQRF